MGVGGTESLFQIYCLCACLLCLLSTHFATLCAAFALLLHFAFTFFAFLTGHDGLARTFGDGNLPFGGIGVVLFTLTIEGVAYFLSLFSVIEEPIFTGCRKQLSVLYKFVLTGRRVLGPNVLWKFQHLGCGPAGKQKKRNDSCGDGRVVATLSRRKQVYKLI